MLASRVLRFRAGSALLLAKRSTGLVGLDVVPDARPKLIEMYKQTLEKITAIPEGAPYRNSVEAITKYRLKVCESTDDVEKIEDEIDCGQIEELMVQAQDELNLIEVLKGVEHRVPKEN